MGANTKIEWATHTFNPWRGCTKVSAGCANCYADRQSKRNPGTLGIWGDNGTRVLASAEKWAEPIKWNTAAACLETVDCANADHADCCPQRDRPRVFCASLADVCEDWQGHVCNSRGNPLWINARDHIEPQAMPNRSDPIFREGGFRPLQLDDVRRKLFQLFDETPNLDWLLLTKRPENILHMMPPRHDPSCTRCFGDGCDPDNWQGRPPFFMDPDPCRDCLYRHNLWLGTSIENQAAAGPRVTELLRCRPFSPVLFLSCEPLLGPLNLRPVLWLEDEYFDFRGAGRADGQDHRIDWVIVGGESGPHARPMHPAWPRDLRDQCRAARVPFFFKQWGEWGGPSHMKEKVSYVTHEWGREFGPPVRSMRVGKKAAGRLLDGKTWDQTPSTDKGERCGQK